MELHSIEEVNNFIKNNELAFLYVTMPSCSVCQGLRPQIESMLEQYPHIKMGLIDASIVEEVRGKFSIFTAPVLLLFINGREYIREARIVHTQVLDKKINRLYKNVVDQN